MVYLVLGIFCLLLISASHSIPISNCGAGTGHGRVVNFGDSLSDNGNTYALSNYTWPSNPAYDNGRFSNGPVWVEDFASMISANLTDRAFGGATSDNALVQGYSGANSTLPVPSAFDQISTYVSSASLLSISSTTHILYVGANDIFFNTSLTAQQVVDRIDEGVQTLKDAGAVSIVLASLPPINAMPISLLTDNSTLELWANFSLASRPLIKSLAQSTNSLYIDFYGFFELVLSDPGAYNFDPNVVARSCLTGAYGETPNVTLCDDPDDYVFWDAYHPTDSMTDAMAQCHMHGMITSLFFLQTKSFPYIPKRTRILAHCPMFPDVPNASTTYSAYL